ncbi:MAG: S8 family peptidase [Solirubrobacteraceae bacterium]
MAEDLPHLPLPQPQRIAYRYPGTPRDERPLPPRNPRDHAARLLADVSSINRAIKELHDVERPTGAEGHLVKARIVPDTPANLRGLGATRAEAVVVARSEDGALVHMRKDDLGPLARKIRAYGDPKQKTRKGAQKNTPLVAPIEELRLATLHDLSAGWLSEDSLEEETTYWVELWVAGGRLASDARRRQTRQEIEWLLDAYESQANIQLRAFAAAEHDIYLLPLHAAVLRSLPTVIPEVYRVAPPQRVQVPWLVQNQHELKLPGCAPPPDDDTVVALLDTGIAERHPLLAPAIHAAGRSVIVGNPDAQDTYGHGTRMAGLVAHRDLAGALAAGGPITARSRIHSIRVMEKGSTDGDIEFWPERTREAIETAEQIRASRRIFNLPIGATPRIPGDHTTWGLAVDTLSHNDGDGRLICVPTGNLRPYQGQPPAYPAENLAAGMTSPGEAVNALTVGAMTDLDATSQERTPVAAKGQLSPYSRCDVGGKRAIKPDIVLEGGNWASDGIGAYHEASLGLLTTDKGHAVGPPLTVTTATSAACSQASGLLSEIWQANPQCRPETIRGLLVHAARWTDPMRAQFPDAQDLRRAFGYGAPRFDRAGYSSSQRATLILESELHPEQRLGNGRELHFVELPLPDLALQALGDAQVEISVTLSFFAEPNENNLRHYQGAGLRWGLQRPLETQSKFRERINKLERTEDYDGAVEDLPWEVGFNARSRGTVQSDRAWATAEELRGSRAVAVWPIGGWWRERVDRENTVVPYSLIVTLDAGEADIDVYTSIVNEIQLQARVDVTIET